MTATLRNADLSEPNRRASERRGPERSGPPRRDLECATLAGADLTGADLAAAFLGGVILTAARLANLSVTDAVGCDSTNLVAESSRHTPGQRPPARSEAAAVSSMMS